jgi:hypothetical protein
MASTAASPRHGTPRKSSAKAAKEEPRAFPPAKMCRLARRELGVERTCYGGTIKGVTPSMVLNDSKGELCPAVARGSIERAQRFERLCYWALAEGLISLSKAPELLRAPISDVKSGLQGPQAAHAHHRQRQQLSDRHQKGVLDRRPFWPRSSFRPRPSAERGERSGRPLEISYPWKCKLTEGEGRCSKVLPGLTIAQIRGRCHCALHGGRWWVGREAPLAPGAG